MLSRLVLAATAVAALTAFVRDDAGAPATAAPQPITPLVTPARAEIAPRVADARPVRVVLAPLYASADGATPVASPAEAFIPTPGSPVGPRGAALTPLEPGHRAAAQAGTSARAERTAKHGRRADPATTTPHWMGPGRQASRSSDLPGVVLR